MRNYFQMKIFPVDQVIFFVRKGNCFNCFRLISQESSTQHNLSRQHEPLNINVQLFFEYVSCESNGKEVIS